MLITFLLYSSEQTHMVIFIKFLHIHDIAFFPEKGASERWMSKGLEFQTTYVWFIRVLLKTAGLG